MEYEKLKDRYIDPFTDFGFKRLFGEECNKELLLDFLNELLHAEEGKIVSLSYIKTEHLGISKESRKAVFDIHCENEKGEKFIVELQKSKQEYFKDRTLYYSTFPIAEQAISGEWNFKLKAVYTIAILDFVFEEDKNDPYKYRYDVMLTDINTHKIFYDKLTFIYLEMPKFTKEVEELNTHFEKWMYVIRNLKRLDAIPDRLRERIFEKMFSAAEVAKLTAEEYRAYVDNLNSYRDLKNCLDYAKADGKAEGWAEGLTEGRAEGRAEGLAEGREEGWADGRAEGKVEEKLEIAKNAKRLGLSIEQIQKLTNLSIEEIENLL